MDQKEMQRDHNDNLLKAQGGQNEAKSNNLR